MSNPLPFALTLVGIALLPAAQAAENSKPNIVLFIADDCTFNDLGCYGGVNVKTPHIDRLAREGMRFSNMHQAVAMSSPTRHNLYTGIYPARSGAYPNHTFAKEGTRSIAHYLNAAGYKTALVGKSHIQPKSVFPFDMMAPLKKGVLDYEAIERFMGDGRTNRQPFFLVVASNQPHRPWTMGNPSKIEQEQIALPPYCVESPETRAEYARYLAEVGYMDGEFGRVMALLDKGALSENTMVVFLSEQGATFPLSKWTCYDMGVRSAAIVRYPGVVEPGSSCEALVEYVDVVPTLVEAVGVKPSKALDGKSFLAQLKGSKAAHKDYTFSMQTTRGIIHGSDFYGIRGISDGEYRYIINLTPEVEFANIEMREPLFKHWEQLAAEGNKEAQSLISQYKRRPARELYNVKRDPYCRTNLAEDPQHAARIERMDKELKAWMVRCGDRGQQTELEAFEHMGNR